MICSCVLNAHDSTFSSVAFFHSDWVCEWVCWLLAPKRKANESIHNHCHWRIITLRLRPSSSCWSWRRGLRRFAGRRCMRLMSWCLCVAGWFMFWNQGDKIKPECVFWCHPELKKNDPLKTSISNILLLYVDLAESQGPGFFSPVYPWVI